mgnify:CR=1 FL=1
MPPARRSRPTHIDKHRDEALAIELLQAGFRTNIVTKVSNLANSKVRKLFRAIYQRQAQGGALPQGYTLLNSRAAVKDCSIAMALYADMGGSRVFDRNANDVPDVKVLRESHPLYEHVVKTLGISKTPALDLNRAWQVALNLKSGEIRLHRCDNQRCGRLFLWAVSQRILPCCPWCDTPANERIATQIRLRKADRRGRSGFIPARHLNPDQYR